jgi:hypothetical protein
MIYVLTKITYTYPLGVDTNNPNVLIMSSVRLEAIGIVNPLVAINVDVAATSSALTATISIPAASKAPFFA